MRDTKFKTLMYCGQYVDTNLLDKGIYSCSIPYLYSKNETIQTIIDKAKKLKDFKGQTFISDSYFENLKLCKLVDVDLKLLRF